MEALTLELTAFCCPRLSLAIGRGIYANMPQRQGNIGKHQLHLAKQVHPVHAHYRVPLKEQLKAPPKRRLLVFFYSRESTRPQEPKLTDSARLTKGEMQTAPEHVASLNSASERLRKE